MNVVELKDVIVKILDEKKGSNIETLTVAGKTTLADYFIVVSASSNTHVRSLAGNVMEKIKEDYGLLPARVEGEDTAKWILIDYSDIIVNIMLEEERDFYRIEDFWNKQGLLN